MLDHRDRHRTSRRDCLRLGLGAAKAGAATAPLRAQRDAGATQQPAPQSVAALVTI
jgi:hypothetical protein